MGASVLREVRTSMARFNTTKAAMLKADPSLAPLLEKLGPGIMGPGGPHHDRGPQGDGPQGPPPPEMDGPPDDAGL